MSEFKGTKGKWNNKGLNIFSESKKLICGCYIVNFNYDSRGRNILDKEGEYNALLISKAPELLDFIQKHYCFLNLEDQEKAVILIKESTEL